MLANVYVMKIARKRIEEELYQIISRSPVRGTRIGSRFGGIAGDLAYGNFLIETSADDQPVWRDPGLVCNQPQTSTRVNSVQIWSFHSAEIDVIPKSVASP